jgi:hypothetical protein
MFGGKYGYSFSLYSKNFDSCVPPTPSDLFSVILPRDKTYDIGLDQSSSCTGIAIRSVDGDLEMIVDVRNNSFNKNTFYRELKGVLRKLVNGRNIRLVVCEDPIPAKGKKYASTVLLELRGQISAWMEEIPEFNQASFNSLYPQSWKSLIVDKSKGKHRSNDKVLLPISVISYHDLGSIKIFMHQKIMMLSMLSASF